MPITVHMDLSATFNSSDQNMVLSSLRRVTGSMKSTELVPMDGWMALESAAGQFVLPPPDISTWLERNQSKSRGDVSGRRENG